MVVESEIEGREILAKKENAQKNKENKK